MRQPVRNRFLDSVFTAAMIVLLGLPIPALAQYSRGESPERVQWETARDAFDKEKYALALQGFEAYLLTLTPEN
jgi:ABC-type spermidine/putrescine transport system permease subunit II